MTEKHLERVRQRDRESLRSRRRLPRGFFLVLTVCCLPFLISTISNWSGRRPDAWKTRYVSAGALLPRNFTVDLEEVEGVGVDIRIAPFLQKMLSDARDAGVTIELSGGYWNVQEQKRRYDLLYHEYKALGLSDEESARSTGRAVPPPGASEHHTGLAVDFAAGRDTDFSSTAAYAWLVEHAGDYGFILRYPKGKENVTGIMYKPWHFRYVGEAAATEMAESGLCLEEYLSINTTEEENGQ